jgi:nucleoside-diphosphate-sugar epimerase
MNVLITGGTGFIGSRLAQVLLDRGHTVQVLGQENTPAERENADLIRSKGAVVTLGSVTDRETVEEITRGVEIVYHLAAAQHEANVPDQWFWDVNVTGTKNLLDASLGSGVERFIHGSTIGVYGSALDGNLDEDSPTKPDNIYGVTKLEGEKLVRSYREKIPAVILRISETYGPGDRRLLKLFKAIKKGAFFIIGRGTNLHHPVYIDDLVKGFLLAASVDAAAGQTFVLGGRDIMTTSEMAEAVARSLGVRLKRMRAPLWPFWTLAVAMEWTLRPLGIQPPLHRRRLDFFKEGAARAARWYEEKRYF